MVCKILSLFSADIYLLFENHIDISLIYLSFYLWRNRITIYRKQSLNFKIDTLSLINLHGRIEKCKEF